MTITIGMLGMLHTHGVSLGVEHEGVLITSLDLPFGIYNLSQHEVFLLWKVSLPSAWVRYEYFRTSANRKLSWLLSFEPPLAAFTLVTAAKPESVRQVALIPTNAFHTQSRYYSMVSRCSDHLGSGETYNAVSGDAVRIIEALNYLRS